MRNLHFINGNFNKEKIVALRNEYKVLNYKQINVLKIINDAYCLEVEINLNKNKK